MTRTIAAIATPPGRGGIGVVRVSGPCALRLASEVTGQTVEWRPRVAHPARWYDERGRAFDSGLVLFFPSPRSFTGEDVVEFHGHGNPVVLQALLDLLIARGAKPAEPGEFCRRAVENGKMDLSQAEAVAATVEAATLRAARQAQRHLASELGKVVEHMMESLTTAVAHIEACLDFPDEEIPEILFEQLKLQVCGDVAHQIDQLLETATFGERLFDGATVAIVGAPNVGKSSLLNALSGRQRAIVSERPGTTRDTLEVSFEISGVPIRLVDTAGLRSSADRVEQEGVRRAHEAAAQADITLFVADVTRRHTWQGPQFRAGVDSIMIMNKVDVAHGPTPAGFIPVSARTGQGMADLVSRLGDRLGDMEGREETLLITRQRHRFALASAADHLQTGLRLLGREEDLELVALEWRRAWAALGGILGIGDAETILDRVFADFCIGK